MRKEQRQINSNKGTRNILCAVVCCAVMFIVTDAFAAAGVRGAFFVYSLSNFSGTVPYSWARLSADRERNEIYVIYKNDVEVFNEKGMKVYSFGDDGNISGVIYDVAVDQDGNIFVLSLKDDNYSVMKCNYRGEPVSTVEFRNFPPGLSAFSPDRIFLRAGLLYLADLTGDKKVIITGTDGIYKDQYDIDALIGLDEYEGKPGQEKDIADFSIDRDGNMLFTIPTLFKAFRISPDRKVQAFGDAGSVPGKFSVVSGIAADESGNYYVADSLKCAVIVFDKEFKFITEFGFRGEQPGNLIAPKDMVVNNGYVYVSQSRERGVSVYKIIHD